MRKGILAIFDTDTEYSMKLMNYVNHKKDFMLEACVFTNKESLGIFVEKNSIEILLAGEEAGKELPDWENVHHLILLSEGKYVREDIGHPVLYKYQSIEHLLQGVLSAVLGEEKSGEAYLCIGGKSRCIAFFSPAGGCGQTHMAIALGQYLARKERVIYLNFELFSNADYFRGCGNTDTYSEARGMSELLYYLRQNKSNLALKAETMTEDIGGLACICPVVHYGDLYELDAKAAAVLIEELEKSGNYATILLDIGFPGEGAWTMMEYCNRVIVPKREGSVWEGKMQAFVSMLKMEGREALCEKLCIVEMIQADTACKVKEKNYVDVLPQTLMEKLLEAIEEKCEREKNF